MVYCKDCEKPKWASFGFLDGKAEYCAEHKLERMINIRNKRCVYLDCNKTPCFNYKDKKIGLYCKLHKELEMIDVVNKRCQQENCGKYPYFNFSTEKKALYCSDHKKDNMVNVRHKKCQSIIY